MIAIELLDGWLVPKMTKNPPHILATGLVRDALYHVVPQGWCVYSQDPVRVQRSMPEPDVMVVRGDLRQYGDRRIRAEDVGLIVEVADASLARDQVFKKADLCPKRHPCLLAGEPHRAADRGIYRSGRRGRERRLPAAARLFFLRPGSADARWSLRRDHFRRRVAALIVWVFDARRTKTAACRFRELGQG